MKKNGLDNLIKGLKQVQTDLKHLEKSQLGVSIGLDDDGFYDRECPNDECLTKFKVDSEDWSNIFKDEAVFCPCCKEEAPADHFFTSEHKEEAIEHARNLVRNTLTNALRNKSRKPIPKITLKAHEILNTKYQCEKCNSKYSIIGTAFFCPCCGSSSIIDTYQKTIKKIEDSLTAINELKKSTADKDIIENTINTIVEAGIKDGVGAFEAYCKESYLLKGGNMKGVRKNVFQNLKDGSDLWKGLIGIEYTDCISSKEFDNLNILVNRRHLLSHNNGIVDESYIKKTNDTSYNIGQKIIHKEGDVKSIIKLTSTIVDTLSKSETK